MNVFGKVAGFFTDKAVGKGVARITLDGDYTSILDLDLDQQTAGVGAILGANSAFPHNGPLQIVVPAIDELHYAMHHKEKSSDSKSDCGYFRIG